MKLFEAFCCSLFWSLFAGALLFLGLPIAVYYISSDGKASIISGDSMWVLLVMYGIYVVIQLILSILNAIQAHHLLAHDELLPEKPRTLYNFFLAEVSLYLIVFVIMVALIPVPEIVGVVIAFSIPYVICCTGSVFIFRFFLRRMVMSDTVLSVPDISDEDRVDDTSREQVI